MTMNTKALRSIARLTIIMTVVSTLLQVTMVRAATMTAASDTMSRLTVSTPSEHAIAFTLPVGVDFDSSGNTDMLQVDFSVAFSESGTWATSDFAFNDGVARTIDAVAQGAGIVDCTVAVGANNVCVAVDTSAHVFTIIPAATYTASATGASVTFTIHGTSPTGILTNPPF